MYSIPYENYDKHHEYLMKFLSYEEMTPEVSRRILTSLANKRILSQDLKIIADWSRSLPMRIIFNKIIHQLNKDNLFVDINKKFEEITRFSINEYMFLVFAVIALCFQRRKEIIEEKGYFLVECQSCGLIYVRNPPSDIERKKFYNKREISKKSNKAVCPFGNVCLRKHFKHKGSIGFPSPSIATNKAFLPHLQIIAINILSPSKYLL